MKEEFTHNAKFYGIPCFWNNETNNLKGKNWLLDFLLTIAVWIEFKFPTSEDGFPILLLDKLNDDDRFH